MKLSIALALSLFLLSTPFVLAQSRFSVSVTAAPVYTHTNAQFGYVVPGMYGQVEKALFSSNTSSVGYVVGAMAHYQLSPSWSVSSGLWYNRSGNQGTFPFSPGAVPARIISQNLQIPLLVNYRTSQRRLSPYLSAGMLANVQWATLYKPEASSGIAQTNVTFGNRDDYRAVLGAGAAYRFSQHLSLIAQPLLIWRFRPSNSYTRFNSYQVNGQVQLRYSF